MSSSEVEREALEIMKAARVRVACSKPYFAHAISACVFRAKPGIGTMACDAYWRIYYDPEVVVRWGVDQTTVGLLHELGHLLRKHFERAKALGVTAETASIANIAQDCAINEHLLSQDDIQLGLKLLPGDSTPDKFGLPSGKTWEEYYHLLSNELSRGLRGGAEGGESDDAGEGGSSGSSASKKDSGRVKGGRDCGSGADGAARPWEDAPPPGTGGRPSGGLDVQEGGVPGLSAAQAEALIRATAEAVQREAQKGRGNVPGELLAWAVERLAPPVVPWQRVLAAEIRSALRYAAGLCDYTYSRRSRRASAVKNVVLPGLHRPAPEVAVVIDTSGSMGHQGVQAALEETQGICQAVGVGVRVVTCDAAVGSDTRQQSMYGAQISVGLGGTDLCVGIHHVLSGRVRPDVIVVITDGDTPWPSAQEIPARVKVLVALVDGDRVVPDYATKVLVEQRKEVTS